MEGLSVESKGAPGGGEVQTRSDSNSANKPQLLRARHFLCTLRAIYLVFMDSMGIEDWRPVLSGDTEQDLASLRELNDNINRLEYKITKMRANLRLLEGALAPYFSSIVPINRCPPEILLNIFSILASDRTIFLANILLVCWNWHDIAMESSSLWGRISFKLKPGMQSDDAQSMIKCVKACIPRSQAAPLHLDLDFSRLVRNRSNPMIDASIIRLLSELTGENGALVARWKRLRLNLPELTGDTHAADEIWKALQASAPNLVDIAIYNTDSALWSLRDPGKGYAVREKPSPIFANLYKLRSLTLDTPETSIVFLKTHSLANIEYLDIPTPSVGAVAAYISQCRALNSLTLRRATLISSEKSRAQGPFILELSMLRNLSLLGGFTRLNLVEYRLPALQTLELGTIPKPSINLPSVNPRVIRWSSEHTDRPYEATELLEAIVRTYRSVEWIEMPQGFGGKLIPIIKRMRMAGGIPLSLNKVVLGTGGERIEVIIVQ